MTNDKHSMDSNDHRHGVIDTIVRHKYNTYIFKIITVNIAVLCINIVRHIQLLITEQVNCFNSERACFDVLLWYNIILENH